jgi:L-alanine-DL-glutamate epimerase-like enolase superfamily enzyme
MGGGAEKGSAGVIIKVHTDEGIVGIADTGGTSAWYRGETQDSIMSMINNVFGPSILNGKRLSISTRRPWPGDKPQ